MNEPILAGEPRSPGKTMKHSSRSGSIPVWRALHLRQHALWKKDEALREAGLLGPAILRSAVRVETVPLVNSSKMVRRAAGNFPYPGRARQPTSPIYETHDSSPRFQANASIRHE
jgi:hypothetical protein